MQTIDLNTMTSQLRYIVAIKLGKTDFYPKSLTEWIEVYFYSRDYTIKNIVLQEIEACIKPEDSDTLKELYFTCEDKRIKDLAFKILPSSKKFNKIFLACKNSISNLDNGSNTIIPRTSAEHDERMLRKMLDNYKTLEELMFILSAARKIEKRLNIFQDSDLRLKIDTIYHETVGAIYEYILSSNINLNHDLASNENDDKLCLFDLNHICTEFSKKDWRDCEKILSIIERGLNGSFDYYASLYQNDTICDNILNIIFSKIESSKPTLEELSKSFEDTRNSDMEKLRNYCLSEIVRILKMTN